MPRLELSDQWDRRNLGAERRLASPFPYSLGFQIPFSSQKIDLLKETNCTKRLAAPPGVQGFAAGVNAVSTSRTSIFATFAPSLIPAFATSA